MQIEYNIYLSIDANRYRMYLELQKQLIDRKNKDNIVMRRGRGVAWGGARVINAGQFASQTHHKIP